MGDQRYFGKASDGTLDAAIAQEWDLGLFARQHPRGVKSRHRNEFEQCPLYPQSYEVGSRLKFMSQSRARKYLPLEHYEDAREPQLLR